MAENGRLLPTAAEFDAVMTELYPEPGAPATPARPEVPSGSPA